MAGYLDFLDRMARQYGIPPEEARAIYQLETASGRNVRRSSAGAQGQMQLMPGTARELGVTDINDPYQNIRGGVQYYAQQRKRFGDPALAAAAYNAGPGRVQRAGNAVPQIGETRQYVANFLKNIGRVRPSQTAPASDTVAQTGAPQGQTTMNWTDLTNLGGLEAASDDLGTAVGYAEGEGGGDTYTGGALPAGDLASYQSRMAKLAEDDAAYRQRQLVEGRERIEKAYAGPTASDRLWALSKALLSPKPYRGFAGTLANVTGAMSGMAEQRRAAEIKRAEALAELQQSYESGTLQSRRQMLGQELDLAKLQAAQEAAARKAAMPSIQLDPQGRLREVPKQVFNPRSRAEYDALPVGAYYKVPSGPQQGQIVQKTT